MNFYQGNVKPVGTCLYLVLKIGSQWWVDREGRPFGPCDSKEEAVSSAYRLIDVFGDPERAAEVWAPRDDGKMEMLWRGRIEP